MPPYPTKAPASQTATNKPAAVASNSPTHTLSVHLTPIANASVTVEHAQEHSDGHGLTIALVLVTCCGLAALVWYLFDQSTYFNSTTTTLQSNAVQLNTNVQQLSTKFQQLKASLTKTYNFIAKAFKRLGLWCHRQWYHRRHISNRILLGCCWARWLRGRARRPLCCLPGSPPTDQPDNELSGGENSR